MAHMVWGEGGFLAKIGSVDFAGGNVVHITSGVSGLVLALTLGKRRGYDQGVYHVHNTPFVFLGAALLWFGWYGFNAGSALAANGLAAHAFMTTSVSAAAGLVSWMLIEVFSEGKTTLVGASTGLVIGLVAITPGAGFVPMWAAVICGLLVSPICYFGVKLIKGKLKIDDALDQRSSQMEWTCLWRDKIICGTDHRNFCIYCSCSCRKFDLHRDRSYLYSTSSGRKSRENRIGCIRTWRKCLSKL